MDQLLKIWFDIQGKIQGHLCIHILMAVPNLSASVTVFKKKKKMKVLQ